MTYRFLYCDGDSNTWGSELVPPPYRQLRDATIEPEPRAVDLATFDDYRRRHAWPAVLADRLGADHFNNAQPGSSNAAIYRRTLDWLAVNRSKLDQDSTLVVIGWTFAHRSEFHDPRNQTWPTIMPGCPVEPERLHRLYYEHWSSDLQASKVLWGQMIGLHHTLRGLGLPHVYFNAYRDNGLDRQDPLRELIPSGLVVPDPMLDRCEAAGCKLGDGFHALADGHAVWADYLAERL